MIEFTDSEKAEIYDYVKEQLIKEIKLRKSWLEDKRFDPALVQITIMALNWIDAMMEDYFTVTLGGSCQGGGVEDFTVGGF